LQISAAAALPKRAARRQKKTPKQNAEKKRKRKRKGKRQSLQKTRWETAEFAAIDERGG